MPTEPRSRPPALSNPPNKTPLCKLDRFAMHGVPMTMDLNISINQMNVSNVIKLSSWKWDAYLNLESVAGVDIQDKVFQWYPGLHFTRIE